METPAAQTASNFTVSFSSYADSVEEAEKCYQGAFDVAVAELPPTNIVRLGLALNFSVFYYEILSNPNKACSLAKIVRLALLYCDNNFSE
jgi:14-3-3 protein epsilon